MTRQDEDIEDYWADQVGYAVQSGETRLHYSKVSGKVSLSPGNTGANSERRMPEALKQHLTAWGFDSNSDYDAVVDAAADWWSTQNPGWDWEETTAHAEWTADAVCYGRSIWG